MLNQNADMRNIELRICYAGQVFFGWQVQPDRRTVQGDLQAVLGKILGEKPIKTVGSSRTDTGVHAHDQHVNFKTRNPIPLDRLKMALNHRLPGAIRVLDIAERQEDFSARYHARGKHYCYYILNRFEQSPFWCDYAWNYGQPLEETAMNAAAQLFLDANCFKSLQSARDARPFSHTTIYQVRVMRSGAVIRFDVIGRNFLYHMVRNMVGSLVKVGSGEWDLAAFRNRFLSGERAFMGKTAPARGLHLFRVFFEEPPYDFCPRSEAFTQRITPLTLAGENMSYSGAEDA